MNEKIKSTEFETYLKGVIFYCYLEYETPMVTVEEFYKTEYSNIWLNRIFEKFAEGKTIQDCSGDLIRTCKKFKI